MSTLDELNDELRQHRTNLQDEKNRHEESLLDIREASGLDEVEELARDVVNDYNTCTDMRSEIRKLFYKGINEMVMADRDTEELSIRDGSIYHKGSNNEVNLGYLISACREELLDCMREENEATVKKILALLDQMDLPEAYLGKGRQHYKAWYKRDGEYKGYDTAYIDTREGLLEIAVLDSVRVGNIQRLEDGFPSGAKRLRISAVDGNQMRFLITFKDEIRQAYEDLHTLIENEMERRREVREEVQDEVAKYIMMSGV